MKKKLLIIADDSPENVLKNTGLIRELQKAGNYIAVGTKKESLQYLERNKYIDKLSGITDLQAGEFDNIIALSNTSFAEKISSDFNVPLAKAKPDFFSWLRNLFGKPAFDIDKNQVEIRRFFGLANDQMGIEFRPNPGAVVTANDLPASHLAGFVVIVAGNELPENRINTITSSVDHPFIIVGSSKPGGHLNSYDGKVYDARGKFTFDETNHLLKMARVVVATESPAIYASIGMGQKVVLISDKKNVSLARYYDQALLRNDNPGLWWQAAMDDVTAVKNSINASLNRG